MSGQDFMEQLRGLNGQPAAEPGTRDRLVDALSAPARHAVRHTRWIAGGLFAVLFLLAAFVPLHSGAVAPGMLAPDMARQVVQHPTGGVVREILVREGQAVNAGQILLRLDATQEDATAGVFDARILGLRAEQAVRRAEAAGETEVTFSEDLTDRAENPEVAPILAAQQEAFSARAAQLDARLQQVRSQRQQIQAQIGAAAARERAASEQLQRVEEELAGYYPLLERGFVPRTRVWATENRRDELAAQVASQQAEQARLRAQDMELAARQQQTEIDARTSAAEALRTVENQLSEEGHRLNAAVDMRDRTVLRAPTSGQVMEISANTVGGVISAGEPVMQIVPDRDRLIVRARVRPQDADTVRAGARATVRFDAVSARYAPRLVGEVESISGDAVTDERTGEAYFEARVVVPPEEASRLPEGAYTPGLPAEVLIETGSRTVLSYLLGPIDRIAFRAMREE